MTENPHAGEGMVVLDIGGDVGAVLVSAPASLAGAELEICPAGRRGSPPDDGGDWWIGEWKTETQDDHPHDHSHGHSHDHAHEHSHPAGAAWPHVAVLARLALGPHVHCAVFPGLRAGRYEVWQRPAEPTALTVEVTGGEVTSADWPTATA